MSFKSTLIWIFLFATGFTYAQVEEVNPPDNIKSITFKSNTSDLGELPIIQLGETFYLEFDALTSDEPDFYYKIEHYDYNWEPSVLVKPEFLLGIDNFRIQDYNNSFNTFQMYSHYSLTIPNQQTKRLKVSGNYIISIYDSYGDLVFSRKFMIYEDIVTPGIAIKRSRDVSTIETTQTVDIEIAAGTQINNPKQTIKTLIIQNSNLNTAISNLKPQYTIGNTLIYRYTKETAFPAGNEYLFLETKDVRAASSRVQSIALEDIYQSYLYTDIARHDLPYTYNPDINGQFKIVAIDRDDVSIEADYVQVHFSLKHSELLNGEHIYIYGNYNNYALNDFNKMTYNDQYGVYQASMILKQGFYNYKYVVVNKDNTLNEGAISGNFWQTENNYKVLVFYRDLGARYDRIIGFNQVTSTNISN
ncbi:type IX secretion system plug protein domain-containing protein [Algibacter sp. R77976]|uniref:type IX secretion system plug protein n=1 Tax=Algibacter sp. R77976 TaxID=3093873 RepID=UPI0037CB3CED